LVAVLPLLASAGATAHGFYDKNCCGDNDCHPVACEQISAVAGGFEYRDAQARATYFFTRDKMKPSPEGCHVCIHHENQVWSGRDEHGAPLCVYLPTGM
jgi:hypothetical protein